MSLRFTILPLVQFSELSLWFSFKQDISCYTERSMWGGHPTVLQHFTWEINIENWKLVMFLQHIRLIACYQHRWVSFLLMGELS